MRAGPGAVNVETPTHTPLAGWAHCLAQDRSCPGPGSSNPYLAALRGIPRPGDSPSQLSRGGSLAASSARDLQGRSRPRPGVGPIEGRYSHRHPRLISAGLGWGELQTPLPQSPPPLPSFDPAEDKVLTVFDLNTGGP